MNAPTPIDRGHEAWFELLPLAIGGAISASERVALDAHLAQCEVCRAELDLLRGAQAQLALEDEAAVAPHAAARSLERVLSRAQAERARGAAPAWWRRRLQAWAQWPSAARWMIAGQAALVVALLALLLPAWLAPPQAARSGFETAAGPTVPAAGGLRVRLAWRDGASAAAVRGLLVALDAGIVDGPSAAGFYTVRFGPGAPADALARLRARTDLVQWAEPL